MKRLALLIVVLPVIVFCCASCGRTSEKNTAEASIEADKKAEGNQIATLAKRCQAVENWQTNLPQRGLLSPVFTFDLSKALVLPNDTPVVLVMELTDVTEHDGKFHAKFTQSYFTNGMFDLYLDLNCSSEQATELLAVSHGDLPSRFALAVKVKEVAKPAFSLRGNGVNEEYEIDVKTDENVFLIKAECADLFRLKNGLSGAS